MTTGQVRVKVDRLLSPAGAEDRAAVLTLEADAFANPWTAETFDRMLTSPVSQVYVARRGDGVIVAFVACWVIDSEIHINTVAVQREQRRRGIGEHLLRELLRLTGATKATLEVRQSNEAALALYRKMGFEINAVRRDYYQNPTEDGLILWWKSMSLDARNP